MPHLDCSIASFDNNCIQMSRNFVLRGGALHRKNYSTEGAHFRLVISSHFGNEVLLSLHSDPTARHLEFFKTYEYVRRRSFWPQLYGTVYKYVILCPICQTRKTSTSTPAGFIYPLQHPLCTFGHCKLARSCHKPSYSLRSHRRITKGSSTEIA